MKSIYKIIVASIIVFMASTTMPQSANAQHPVVTLQLFYDELAPYGQWVHHPDYGYIWIPSVDQGFMPYSTDGHWVLTDAGWTWVSDYRWGWAPFHYGRWAYDDSYGWYWVPDVYWGPAWVSWRRSDDYFGWTPLAPGISVNASFDSYEVPASRWMFVRQADIARPDINKYYIDRTKNVTIIHNTTIIKNTYVNTKNVTYVSGPRAAQVNKVAATPVQHIAIHNVVTPAKVSVTNTNLNIYRPTVQKVVTPAPVPQKVVEWNNTKPSTPAPPHPSPAPPPHPAPAPPQQNHPQPPPPKPQPPQNRPPGNK